MKRTITKDQLKDAVNSAYDAVYNIKGGKNADYIPFLAGVKPNLFGLAIALPTGETFEVGDSQYVFGVESISKVFTAILVLKQHGAKMVLDKIGADATGLPFNSIMAILLENEHPSTPLVNAGAISAVSMITPTGNAKSKWQHIEDCFTQLCGSAPTLLEELYHSESDTNYNNKAISWLLKNYNRIYDSPDLSLDLYTRQCSLGVTAKQLAIAGCTIANFGTNPITKEKVFSPDLMPKIISLIASVGFYEHTGDWMYTCGIPAKTGVGGGVMGVVPGVLGIAAFAPPLDDAGNSVKAQAAIQHIAQELSLGVFNGYDIEIV